jgi:hypothetical protein
MQPSSFTSGVLVMGLLVVSACGPADSESAAGPVESGPVESGPVESESATLPVGSASVTPGVEDAGPAADLAAARDQWRHAEPRAWSATIEWIDSAVTDGQQSCGSGPTHVVVVEGDVVEAIDLERDCPVDDPLTINGLFDRADELADAIVRLSVDDEFGFPTHLVAGDDTREVEVAVFDFRVQDPDDPPPARGDLEAARQRWADAGIDDYHMAVEVECFCSSWGVVDVRVVAGAVVSLEPREAEFDAADFAWTDLTVDAIFDDIDRTITTGDVLAATYDPELGHPVVAELDPQPSWVDDERTYRVTEFEPGE